MKKQIIPILGLLIATITIPACSTSRHNSPTVATIKGSSAACLQNPQVTESQFNGVNLGQISQSGRWLIDSKRQVVIMHGVNLVAKTYPYYPCFFGFDNQDAAFLEANGLDVVRLGVLASGVMPRKGAISASYINNLATTVNVLAAHHIYTLLDWHQDDWGPYFQGDGFPDWMTLTGSQPDIQSPFPIDYTTNPALEQAFKSFWDDQKVKNGLGLQEYFIQMLKAVTSRFVNNPWVLGTDLINEPSPGFNTLSCLVPGSGCPELESQKLLPFYLKAYHAIRSTGSKQIVLFEPFAAYNLGAIPVGLALPKGLYNYGLSFHRYPVTAANQMSNLQGALTWSSLYGGVPFNTEWSNSSSTSMSQQTSDGNATLMSWTYWVFDNCKIACSTAKYANFLLRSNLPPSGSNLNYPIIDNVVQPYPLEISGTPLSFNYNGDTKVFTFSYSTTRVNATSTNSNFPVGSITQIIVPKIDYPAGYNVSVQGATVSSAKCSSVLKLSQSANDSNVNSQSSTINVQISPSSSCK